MITKALFALVRLVVEAIVALLPPWTPLDVGGVATSIADALGPAWGALVWLDFYVPVTETMAAVLLLGTLHASALAFHALVWVLEKFHLAG